MKTMELFKVSFDTKDFEALERWNKAFDVHLRNSQTVEEPFLEPMPGPKQYERYVAVHGAFGMDMATRARVAESQAVEMLQPGGCST